MWHKLFRTLSSLFGVGLFALALIVLYHELHAYHYHDIVRHAGEIPVARLFGAFGFVVLSYGGLTGYEVLALRSMQRILPYPQVALVSFVSYAFSHTVGLTVLSGAAVRYRLYATFGMSAVDIARVVAFCSLTFWLGFTMLSGLLFFLTVSPLSLPWSFVSLRLLGAVLLLLPAGYLLGSLLYKKPLQWRGWDFFWPPLSIAASQIVVSMVEWSAAAGVLYVLLPAGIMLSYWQFLGIFLLAQMAGIMSMVPGGVGVFETMLLLWLSPWVAPPIADVRDCRA